jgi:polyisoprenoid-binding protein YceI
VRQVLQRTQWRIGLAAAVVVVGIAAGAYYVFGFGGSSTSPSAGAAAAPTLAPAKNATIFTIDPSSSDATFTIHEVLFGQPNTVVGRTSQVAGQIRVDTQDPAQSQVGQIRVDLSALVTDNDLRNQTLQHRILETSDPSNQYATFVAKSLKGLPSTITVGQPVSFQITGDLTVHGVTRTVTFDAKVTEQNATTLVGQAQTTVRYEDFNIAIPNVPSVTGVTDNVALALSFVATA